MTSSSGLNNRRLDITDPIHCQIVKWHLVGRHVEYTIDVRRGYNSTTTRQLIRRYSQFASLNRRLAHDGRGMQFPSFPPKKLVGNTNTTFVASRALALQTFLDNITSHPIIYASEMVLEFFDLLQVDAQTNSDTVSMSIRNLEGWQIDRQWKWCGWRADKLFYVVRSADNRPTRQHLLTWTSYGPDWCLRPESTADLIAFVRNVQSPLIAPSLFDWCGADGAVLIRQLHPNGSLRDHFHKSNPSDPYLVKYSFDREVYTLQHDDVCFIGRNVLEALHLLHTLDISYVDIHCGNVLITEHGCQLLDVEQAILGTSCIFRPAMVLNSHIKTIEDMQVFAFGQLIYEMLTGFLSMPTTNVDIAIAQCPVQFRMLLTSIFVIGDSKRLPTISDLIDDELFANVPVVKMSTSEVRISTKRSESLSEIRNAIESRLLHDRQMSRHATKMIKVQMYIDSVEQRTKRKQLIKQWSENVCGRFVSNPE